MRQRRYSNMFLLYQGVEDLVSKGSSCSFLTCSYITTSPTFRVEQGKLLVEGTGDGTGQKTCLVFPSNNKELKIINSRVKH